MVLVLPVPLISTIIEAAIHPMLATAIDSAPAPQTSQLPLTPTTTAQEMSVE